MLFAITVLCFAGILWAALAFARHIKSGHLRPEIPRVAPHASVAATIKKAPAPEPLQQDFRHHFLTAPADVPARSTREPLNQSLHDIVANKQWTLPPHATRIHRLPLRTVAAAIVTTPASDTPSAAADRKPIQPARSGRLELLDPAYFNKDMADLSDPRPSNNLRANDRASINHY